MTKMEARNVLMVLVVLGFFAVVGALVLRGPAEVAVVEDTAHGAVGEPESRGNPFGATPAFLVKTPDGVSLIQRERSTPLIQSLLLVSSPAAIARLIVPVNFGPAVQSLTSRAFAHVGKEVGEFLPPLANRNAAPSVVAEVLALRIRAPLEHRIPRLVRRGAVSAVSRVHVRREVAAQTSTGANEASSQRRSGNDVAASAITDASPKTRAALAFACPSDCRQATESMSSDVHWMSGHAFNFTASSGWLLWR